jgi:hypothetical protein
MSVSAYQPIFARRGPQLFSHPAKRVGCTGEHDWPKWLNEEPASERELLTLLKPCPDEALKNLAGRQNGWQRKKQWASAGFA